MRRRANTRARLLEAAAGVFAEKGLHGATIDDLVTAAGFTRGAFYSNFSTMEEAFCALFEQQSAQMLALARETIESIPDEEFTVHSVGVVLERLRPFGRQWYLVHTEFVLHALRNPGAATVFAGQVGGWRAQLADMIDNALARLRRVPTVSTGQLVEVLFSLYLDSLAREHLGCWPGGPDQVLDDVLPAILMSLSVPEGDPPREPPGAEPSDPGRDIS